MSAWGAIAGAAILVVVAGLAFLFGQNVSTLNPYANEILKVGVNEVVVQDATKRNIMVTPAGTTCSEPPPDAIGTLAAQLTAKAAGQGAEAAAAPSAESADASKAIGKSPMSANAETNQQLQSAIEKLYERSQGIQALRDMMYRLCEAMQNKALDEEMYRNAMFHILGSLNFVIPFEQCATLASKSGGTNVVGKCFENVVSYSTTMLARLQSEMESFSQATTIDRERREAEVHLAQYHRAFHYLFVKGFEGLPAELVPKEYVDRLARDLSSKEARKQDDGGQTRVFYPGYDVKPAAGLPPAVLYMLQQQAAADAAATQPAHEGDGATAPPN